MNENGNRRDCSCADEMVSYIYDELAAHERREFESHLAGCSACTDQFAGISDARLSVFEWQKEEFANLPTPVIDVPYRKASPDIATGWRTGLQRLMGFPALAGAAAVLVASLGIGFAIMNLQSGGETAEVKVDESEPPATSPLPQAEPRTSNHIAKVLRSDTSKPPIANDDPRPRRTPIAGVKAGRATAAKVGRRNKQNAVPNIAVKAKPALTNFDEPVDRSLRLTDLVGDGGR